MNNFVLKWVFIFLLMIPLAQLTAQLRVDAQIRNRAEFRNGYQKLAEKNATPAFFISQRTRFTLLYETEDFKLHFSPQDVRVWGDEEYASLGFVMGNKASIDMFEGFFEIRTGDFGWLSIGRQTLAYDNQWILSSFNWHQRGASTDAVLYKYDKKNWKIHLAGSWNSLHDSQSDIYFPADRLKTLNFLWINNTSREGINSSFLHVGSGVTESDSTNTIHFRQTSGVYTNIRHNSLLFEGNAYYQYGKNPQGQKISAYLLLGDISFKSGKFTPGIGAVYLSGNRSATNTQKADNLFDPIYGGRHKMFGNIDYFTSYRRDTREGGLVDYYFYLKYYINESLYIQNTSHYFQLAQTNPYTSKGRDLGFENDFFVQYRISKIGTLQSGYSFFLPNENLKELQNRLDIAFSHFFYLMVTFSPSIYKN